MVKKFIFLLVVLILLMLVSTGCGSNDETPYVYTRYNKQPKYLTEEHQWIKDIYLLLDDYFETAYNRDYKTSDGSEMALFYWDQEEYFSIIREREHYLYDFQNFQKYKLAFKLIDYEVLGITITEPSNNMHNYNIFPTW